MAVGIVIVLFFALVMPLVLWVAISQETSNPTVVDRAEAERIAKERGGRRQADSSSDAGNRSGGDGRDAVGWGDRPSAGDGTRIGDDGRDDEDRRHTHGEY